MSHPLVAALDLTPHPEGGWFRETMRLPASDGGRGAATAILFLLDADDFAKVNTGWRAVRDELAEPNVALLVPVVIDLLLRGDLLITEHQDVLIQMRAVYASEVCVVQRTGQIQADDFCAHLFGEWTHIELLIRRLRGRGSLGGCWHENSDSKRHRA